MRILRTQDVCKHTRSLLERGLAVLPPLSLMTAVIIVCGCASLSGESTLQRAEKLASEGRHQEAISAYNEHIEDRLSSSRPEWENPYFYLLRIGDLKLLMAQPEDALQTFAEAEQHNVDPVLISDRYRTVAHWYLEHGRTQEAFDLLNTHRNRDSLLFDALLDRVGRSLTQTEPLPKPTKKRAE